ncbi:glycoside hydrolase family 16 protein [Artomyces pyxidatus]|uniref:Glycoside hydrolase family 16 protein n=1 Tax=Artomyces pyxidatus TaxID=48021 RepID=A0ACB8SZT6_9AGAM|nr:glycoside hydrolase family 16 protein [Artomyces pyxidatus]
MPAGRNDMAQGVASGAIGAGYGPYAHNGGGQNYTAYTASRFSAAPSEVSSATGGDKPQPTTSTTPPYLWDVKDPDLDDALHNPDPRIDAAQDRSFTIFSARGWANVSVLVVLVAGLLTLFAGYPIIAFVRSTPLQSLGANFGGSNKTGQIPELVQLPQLIDPATESQFYSKTGSDGRTWNLVFSDEFNTDGRTFWPGDDPFWEAVDLHYWPTGDLEWYNPQAITTKGGKLVITMTEQDNHNLNFQSGMLQSWNKFCFTTGIVEVSVSLPGSPQAPGFWPGVWSMGNLGRAGYGATTEGTWPYSYAACDTGTFINQTDAQGQPSQALTGAPGGGQLSLLPGQRLSACTCPGSEHPGPNVNVGRNVPEIDILEAQIDVSIFRGEASQSFQVAPFNYLYQFDNSSTSTPISDPTLTKFNTYKGDLYQQAISAVTYLDNQNYGGNGYAPYAYEWWSDPKNRDDGYIQWYVDGQPTWKLTSATLAGDSETKISSRIVPEEPMYIILNFGMAPSFQHQDFEHLVFPSEMLIDYVRVYQREDVSQGVGCDPSSRPTADYITKHMNAYTNPNLTTWASAGYQFPRNSLYDGC